MKRIRTIGGTMAITLLCAAASAQAQHGGGPPHGGPGRECREQLIGAVGLTDAEQTALTALREQTRASVSTLETSGRSIHEQVEAALAAPSPDPTAIGKLMIQVNGFHQQIETIRKNAEATFVASLTAEQQTKYAALIAANPHCAAFPNHMHMPGPPAA